MEWHEVKDPNDPELDRLASRYQIHPLHVEDCRHRSQRAKIEESGAYLFAVFKPVKARENGDLAISDLDVFLGRDWVITVQEPGDSSPIPEPVRAAAASSRADQFFYRIADAVVDSYFPILDGFDDAIDELEGRVLNNPSPKELSRIFEIKRNLIELRRVMVNTRDVAGHLQRTECTFIRREMWPFLRDLYDHVARNLDTLEAQRDLLNGTLDVYLSSVANRTNQVMKVLTVLGTIALPALVISSFYGMNLKGLPWLDSPHGIEIVSIATAALTIVLLVLLRLFRWL
jgi:magnesium transporter